MRSFWHKMKHLILKEARLANHLTQEQLGVLAGRSKSLISRIERGRNCGSVATLRALARALDLSFDDLLGGDRSQRLAAFERWQAK